MRTLLLSSLMLFGAPTALACSCVVDDEMASAEREYKDAQVVFKGYLLGQQLVPMQSCNEYNPPKDPFHPVGLFKVVEADKGTSDGATVVARLGGVFAQRFDENCNLYETGTSCQHSFDASQFGRTHDPKWLAFSLHNGVLYANSQDCSGFSSNGQAVVNRLSKRDKSECPTIFSN